MSFFKPSDFNFITAFSSRKDICQMANAKRDVFIEDLKAVIADWEKNCKCNEAVKEAREIILDYRKYIAFEYPDTEPMRIVCDNWLKKYGEK